MMVSMTPQQRLSATVSDSGMLYTVSSENTYSIVTNTNQAIFCYIAKHRRSQGDAGGGAIAPRIQDWQSTKNRRLEDPIPYVPVLLERLLNEKL